MNSTVRGNFAIVSFADGDKPILATTLLTPQRLAPDMHSVRKHDLRDGSMVVLGRIAGETSPPPNGVRFYHCRPAVAADIVPENRPRMLRHSPGGNPRRKIEWSIGCSFRVVEVDGRQGIVEGFPRMTLLGTFSDLHCSGGLDMFTFYTQTDTVNGPELPRTQIPVWLGNERERPRGMNSLFHRVETRPASDRPGDREIERIDLFLDRRTPADSWWRVARLEGTATLMENLERLLGIDRDAALAAQRRMWGCG